MTADITFHYPPVLFNLLVDTIPALNRGKKDMLVFFRGAGVPDELLNDLAERVADAPDDIRKNEIARLTLERLTGSRTELPPFRQHPGLAARRRPGSDRSLKGSDGKDNLRGMA